MQFSIIEFRRKWGEQLCHEGWGVRRYKKFSHMDGLWQLPQGSQGGEGGTGFVPMLKQTASVLRRWPRSASQLRGGLARLRAYTGRRVHCSRLRKAQTLFLPASEHTVWTSWRSLLTRTFQSSFPQFLQVLNKYFRNCHETQLNSCSGYQMWTHSGHCRDVHWCFHRQDL